MRPFLLAIFLCGCGSARPTVDRASETTATRTASEPVVADGAVAMEPVCFAQERCEDALDSDCDGWIDEGCDGITGAALTVGLAWSGHARLDLELSPDEGTAFRTEGACEDDGWARLVLREVASPAPGEHRVAVVRREGCEGAEPVRASVSVAYAGELIGAYTVTVEGERADVVRFTLE